MTLSDKIRENKFAKELIGATGSINSSHLKLYLQDRSLNYDELDTEQRVKKITIIIMPKILSLG